MHEDNHPMAGRAVTLNDRAADPVRGIVVPGAMFHVEDWADLLMGESIWQLTNSNMAVAHYAYRIGAIESEAGPGDDDVVYVKDVNGLGHVIHESEIEGEVTT